jgi:hypothetical protein
LTLEVASIFKHKWYSFHFRDILLHNRDLFTLEASFNITLEVSLLTLELSFDIRSIFWQSEVSFDMRCW